ncbi:MAG: nucleoside phosphorylase [Desulfobulbaceae bacterium]|nr:nucleoside phosphorylase [Desulfobulbaceae bacterium]
MTTCVINPQWNKGEPRLSPAGILAVNPSDSTVFPELAKRHGLQRAFLFNAGLYSGDALFLAGPAVGAPMAVICLEKLIALGATRIVLYGWCGSLIPSLRVGDLFVPTGCLSEEGTSSHYPPPAHPFDESFSLALCNALSTKGYQTKRGAIWTTDAVYRETRDKVQRYGTQGLMAVDMEYAALRAVAAFRGVSLAAVLLVSDELYHQEWTPRFHQKTFRTESKNLIDQLCALIQSSELGTI